MDSISLEKYRDLTKHLVCAMRNYEMSNNLNDRSYALSILSNVIHSASNIDCGDANRHDRIAMRRALSKAQEIIIQYPVPCFVTHAQACTYH